MCCFEQTSQTRREAGTENHGSHADSRVASSFISPNQKSQTRREAGTENHGSHADSRVASLLHNPFFKRTKQ